MDMQVSKWVEARWEPHDDRNGNHSSSKQIYVDYRTASSFGSGGRRPTCSGAPPPPAATGRPSVRLMHNTCACFLSRTHRAGFNQDRNCIPLYTHSHKPTNRILHTKTTPPPPTPCTSRRPNARLRPAGRTRRGRGRRASRRRRCWRCRSVGRLVMDVYFGWLVQGLN